MRMSNTEPLLRLNVEARTTDEVDEVVGQVSSHRGGHVNGTSAVVDLDDAEGLLAADRDGLLRAASMAGAQVRSAAAALDEGDLDALKADQPPRTVIWVAGRGTAERAGAMLAAAVGGAVAAPIVVVPDAPLWIGALDVLILAGDDPGDPTLASAAATAVRRGARVVVVAPFEGPLRDATAGRGGGAPAADAGFRRLRAGRTTSAQAWPRYTPWIRRSRSICPRSPTNWMPRRCATAPRASCSPIRQRLWQSACLVARSCWRATPRRRWRWLATARRCCCGSRTGWSPRSVWPTRSSRFAAGWGSDPAPGVRVVVP